MWLDGRVLWDFESFIIVDLKNARLGSFDGSINISLQFQRPLLVNLAFLLQAFDLHFACLNRMGSLSFKYLLLSSYFYHRIEDCDLLLRELIHLVDVDAVLGKQPELKRVVRFCLRKNSVLEVFIVLQLLLALFGLVAV